MASNRHRRLFEELAVLNDTPESNPIEVLGIDPAMVDALITEDASGDAVRFIADAMHKVLVRRYHPDVPKTGDEERFRMIDDAEARIQSASVAALKRWVQERGANNAPSGEVRRIREAQEEMISALTDVLQSTIELGAHPQHFSRLEWSQGVLLQRDASMLLMRERDEGGLTVRLGQLYNPEMMKRHHSAEAADFHKFLKSHGLFGLSPGREIVTYLDEAGNASILTSDLGFIMDITGPVQEYRVAQQRKVRRSLEINEQFDLWSRYPDPLILTTTVPVSRSKEQPTGRIVTFPERGAAGAKKPLIWELPMQVAGTLEDTGMYRRMRYNKAAGVAQLAGANAAQSAGHFNLLATPTRQLVERMPGYSPLLGGENALLLFDPVTKMPVVTDVKVIGMIGSGASAA